MKKVTLVIIVISLLSASCSIKPQRNYLKISELPVLKDAPDSAWIPMVYKGATYKVYAGSLKK